MSSTAGGGGGGAGGTGFAAGFLVVAPGFGLGFELPVAGFFVVVLAAFGGEGVWARDTGASRHAATRAAVRFRAREDNASMVADSTRGAALRVDNHALETRFERQAQRARFDRVKMAVLDGRTFTGQLALVEICDVVVV